MFDPKSQPTNESYNNLGRNLSAKIKKSNQNYRKYMRVNDPDMQFRVQNTDDETDSCSPPSWKSSSLKDTLHLHNTCCTMHAQYQTNEKCTKNNLCTMYTCSTPTSRSIAIAQSQKEFMEMKKYMRVNETNDPDHIQFRVQNTNDETESCSPPLWKSSFKSRAIAQSQKELMEMARNVPESCYELSLRDMVEIPIVLKTSPKLDDDEERCLIDEKMKKSVKIVKRQESKKVEKKMDRVKSANLQISGSFLKMNIPIFFRSKRKNNLVKSNGKRVSPKVDTLGKSSLDSSFESIKSRITTYDSGSSNNNNNNINRKSKGWSFGCWAAFTFSRGKNKKSK